MAKTRTKYVCENCGRQSARLMGRCPNCGEFNTMVEVVEEAPGRGAIGGGAVPRSRPQKLREVSTEAGMRLPMPIGEFARVLGGGIVPGSVVLIGGDPGIGKCVTAATRILDVDTGAYRSIEALKHDPGQVLAIDPDTLRMGPQNVTAFFERGTKFIVRIKTKLGRTLECTPEHPLLTMDGWQPAESLGPGTRIAAPRELPYFGAEALPESHVKLIAYVLSDGSAQSQISITNQLPEVARDAQELADAFGVGLVVYEKPGSKARQFRFTVSHAERAKARQEFAQALRTAHQQTGITWMEWSRRANVHDARLNTWRCAACVPTPEELHRLAAVVEIPVESLAPEARDRADSCTTMARFLGEIGLRYKTASEKTIPDCIFRLPREQLALFLKILFTCDGSVFVINGGMPGVSYTTISRRLAEDVQHLLLRFGLVAKLRTKSSKVNGQAYEAYEVTLQGVSDVRRFLDEIGIMGRETACAEVLSRSQPERPSTQRDTVPINARFWDALREATEGATFAEIYRAAGVKIKYRRLDRPVTRYLIEHLVERYPHPYLNALGTGDVYWDEIESIAPAGEAPVFDISVAQHANFVANDLVIHNSTLLLDAAAKMADKTGPVLYVSGEESAQQIRMRADRLGLHPENLYLVTETGLEAILEHVGGLNPQVLVVDSIQTTFTEALESSAGSVSQVRECANRLRELAKSSGIAVFVVGHVTKEGAIAGPRVLEHIVDTVLYLEGDPFQAYRLLRSVKNRFGATSEVGVFEMRGTGLAEVSNPSEAFLAERVVNASGSAIAVTLEGTRPLLVEVQALSSLTTFGYARRTANGIDYNRLLLLAAVLTRRMGFKLAEQDLFVNVIGGLKIDEPAADLAVAVAIASSYLDRPVPADLAIVGEIGLSGELRAVSQLPLRLNEAAKLGFKRILVPRTRRKDDLPGGIEILPARNIAEAFKIALPEK